MCLHESLAVTGKRITLQLLKAVYKSESISLMKLNVNLRCQASKPDRSGRFGRNWRRSLTDLKQSITLVNDFIEFVLGALIMSYQSYHNSLNMNTKRH